MINEITPSRLREKQLVPDTSLFEAFDVLHARTFSVVSEIVRGYVVSTNLVISGKELVVFNRPSLAHAASPSAPMASRTRWRVAVRGSLPCLRSKTKSGSPANFFPKEVGVRLLSAMNASTVSLKVSISLMHLL